MRRKFCIGLHALLQCKNDAKRVTVTVRVLPTTLAGMSAHGSWGRQMALIDRPKLRERVVRT